MENILLEFERDFISQFRFYIQRTVETRTSGFFYYANAAANPILYNIMNSRFRDAFATMMRNFVTSFHENCALCRPKNYDDVIGGGGGAAAAALPKRRAMTVAGAVNPPTENFLIMLEDRRKSCHFGAGTIRRQQFGAVTVRRQPAGNVVV